MPTPFQLVFARLRSVLQMHEGKFSVSHDTFDRYGLEAPVGPSTVRAWGGKVRATTIPVAWVEVRKSYVSYHLMGIEGNAVLMESLSTPLRARMQGKSCFNFRKPLDAAGRRAVAKLLEGGFKLYRKLKLL